MSEAPFTDSDPRPSPPGDDPPSDYLLTEIHEVLVAFDTRRVEEVEDVPLGEGETRAGPADLGRWLRPGAPLANRGSRVLTLRSRGRSFLLLAGENVRLVQLTGEHRYKVPPFLGYLENTMGVEALVRCDDRVALLVDIDRLLKAEPSGPGPEPDSPATSVEGEGSNRL